MITLYNSYYLFFRIMGLINRQCKLTITEFPIFDLFVIHQYLTGFDDNDIFCVDNDGDGYYTWGNGPKPAQCPSCPEEPDGDDSDPCLGTKDEFGHIRGKTPTPIVNDVTISDTDPVPDLAAVGDNIRWYQDEGLDTLVCEGNSFRTGRMSIGPERHFCYYQPLQIISKRWCTPFGILSNPIF